jgi:hypothetical protein
LLAETVALLESLSDRAAELAAALPGLGLDTEDLTNLAEVVQRIHGQLEEAEERLAVAGPSTEVAALQRNSMSQR